MGRAAGVDSRLAAVGKFPELDGVVPTCRGEPAAIGTEDNVGNLVLVTRKSNTVRRQWVARQWSRIPQADGMVIAGGREPVAIRTECYSGDRAVVGEDRKHLAASCAIQYPQGAIEAGHSDPLAVGAERDGTALVRVALLVDLQSARSRVPDLDETVEARPGQSPRIGCELGTQRIHQAFAVERKCLAPALDIPNLDRAIVTGRHHGPAIGTERHALDRRRMRRNTLESLVRWRGPTVAHSDPSHRMPSSDYPG